MTPDNILEIMFNGTLITGLLALFVTGHKQEIKHLRESKLANTSKTIRKGHRKQWTSRN